MDTLWTASNPPGPTAAVAQGGSRAPSPGPSAGGGGGGGGGGGMGLASLKQERGLPPALDSPFGGASLGKKKPLGSTFGAGLGADASFLSKNKSSLTIDAGMSKTMGGTPRGGADNTEDNTAAMQEKREALKRNLDKDFEEEEAK